MVHVVHKLPKKHKMLILGILAAMAGVALIPSEKATASRDNDVSLLEVGKRYELPLDVIEPNIATAVPDSKVSQTAGDEQESQISQLAADQEFSFDDFKVKSGDSLAIIFKQAGLSPQTLHQIVNLSNDTKQLTSIHPGETLSFAKDNNGELLQLKYVISKTDTLLVTREANGNYRSHIDSKEVDTVAQSVSGQISSSFWTAGITAGLSERQIMNFADIFGWDVDFANDIREGDQFSLLFETHYVDGELIGTGEILAAEFINQGERFAAVKHSDGEFYTPEGRSMKKAFLRAPVNFKYISSNFNPRRLHPVTGKVSAHRGIDYAARVGTPVVASGNGKVLKSGYNDLNGNYVFIQHGSQYVTKYLHLDKRYAKTGDKIRQGEKIGTVGATGRVTGAHLHYEFLVNGVHRNPKTVPLPKSEPLPAAELANFKPLADQRLALLERNRSLQLALNN
ncbi:peptidoglycan DD-metalloendopeptidase family protein [Pseudoalteromonas fenneropenaei]|uniref:Peptidoglycan DD-metalloendopeptidase family protein n=1 Tax=Pseudoalteromonas fenneropenaei TaxID=1737459 RepID=A0ABV7CCH9_9GAMM